MREFLLGNQWLEEAVERFNDKGWSAEQITDYINACSSRVVGLRTLSNGGRLFGRRDPKIVNSAIDEADFDLNRLPVIPSV